MFVFYVVYVPEPQSENADCANEGDMCLENINAIYSTSRERASASSQTHKHTHTLCHDNQWLHDLRLWSSSPSSPLKHAHSCLHARTHKHEKNMHFNRPDHVHTPRRNNSGLTEVN